MNKKLKEFLDEKVSTYDLEGSPHDKVMRKFVFRTFKSYMRNAKNSKCLELGCSDGHMSSLIAKEVKSLDIVDGSKKFIDMAKKRGIPNAIYHHMLFEEMNFEKKYDYIFASYILEHMNDPVGLLKKIKKFLKEDGYIFVIVPNANVISRQLGLHMGLFESLYSLTENDINHGHTKVYDRVLLNRDIFDSGLNIVSSGGVYFKPFANFQLDQIMNMGVIKEKEAEGLYSLGQQYPDLCSGIYSVCSL